MVENKTHWYDGWFYDKVVAPNQDKLFTQIRELVDPESKVLDVGCGTGRLEFSLAARCKSVMGIDLSERNIERAQLNLKQQPNGKISFKHTTVGDLIIDGQSCFDFAILTFVIHEVNKDMRIDLLKEISTIADKIIIGDYLVPRPKGMGSLLTEAIEFIAGKDHYRAYKSYIADGGIKYLTEKAGLKIIAEISNDPLSNHIVVLSK